MEGAMPDENEFAAELRRLREEKGLSIEQVADLFYQISPGLVEFWESEAMVPEADLQEIILRRLKE